MAIVVQYRLDGALARAVARAAGTAAGVLAGSLLLLGAPPQWLFVLLVTGLASARPFLKAHNYALYATIMTPLVVLLPNPGQPATAATIGYRLANTAIGAAIALGAGYLFWLRAAPQPQARGAGPNGGSPERQRVQAGGRSVAGPADSGTDTLAGFRVRGLVGDAAESVEQMGLDSSAAVFGLATADVRLA